MQLSEYEKGLPPMEEVMKDEKQVFNLTITKLEKYSSGKVVAGAESKDNVIYLSFPVSKLAQLGQEVRITIELK